MTLDALKEAPKRVVGAHQTAKAIARGRAVVVFVSRDAARRITEPVVRAAEERGLPVVEVETGRELGRACGIAVGAAAAAILRS
ncbi:MAG: ribosomal L7Ae/L30e/S12e/Gadd45 family protein [Armatimonadota bacterium]|nr:ribosomal L7Ae/L30e/S12e/Gadd45 family protein [Armatimonadota bacterium]MDR5697671.1 ribosomal L7Ae/L30e/S12e/Gadd45 family protein [Armatimonadota bacterium]